MQGSQAAFVKQVNLDHILVGAKDDDHGDDDFDGEDGHEDGNDGLCA